MHKTVISMLLVLQISQAKEGISLKALFADSFGKDATVSQKIITLKQSQVKTLQKMAKAKIDSSKIRFYVVKQSKNTLGYGVLLNQRVRTKKATLLYLVDKEENIKSIEILSFKEPSEYKPNDTWKEVFNGKNRSDNLFSGKGIPTISGATMSVRAISDATRIALAIIAQETK